MSKYGFGGGVKLPEPAAPKTRKTVDPGALEQALAAGEELGFISREASAPKRKPGPKRTEPQDKVSIPGPKRVVDAFRNYCTEENVTLWQGLEQLLEMQRGRGGR